MQCPLVTRMSIILITDRNCSAEFCDLHIPNESVTVIGVGDDLDILREVDPELVLLDCCDPQDRRVRMLEKIKRLRYDLPVIFLADKSSEELVIRVFRAGAREYIKKPVQPEELKSTIMSILKLRRQTPGKRLSLQSARNLETELPSTQLAVLPTNILRAVKFIERNCSAPLTLEEIAGVACLSKFHFSRVFKSHLGVSPKQFILTRRINRALALMRNPDLNISTVALQAGFNELGELTRQFRKLTGLTPSAFRDSIKPISPLYNSK
jgi:AraC-like DNA-binding protein